MRSDSLKNGQFDLIYGYNCFRKFTKREKKWNEIKTIECVEWYFEQMCCAGVEKWKEQKWSGIERWKVFDGNGMFLVKSDGWMWKWQSKAIFQVFTIHTLHARSFQFNENIEKEIENDIKKIELNSFSSAELVTCTFSTDSYLTKRFWYTSTFLVSLLFLDKIKCQLPFSIPFAESVWALIFCFFIWISINNTSTVYQR